MLGGLPLGLPGLLALMLEGVAGLPIRWECELGRRPTGCTRRHCSLPVIATVAIIAAAIIATVAIIAAAIIAAAIIAVSAAAVISTAICTRLNSAVDASNAAGR
jgi:hypothetical protein